MSAAVSTSPLQVYLDEADRERLEAWSKRRGWTKSDAIRAAIRALVGSSEPPDTDPLLGASGMIRGLAPDASVSFERYLMETFVAHKTTKTRRWKKLSKRSGHKPARARLRR